MAAIGGTLGFPKASEMVSAATLLALLVLITVAGLAWLVVDYARMLLLYRKMVRSIFVKTYHGI